MTQKKQVLCDLQVLFLIFNCQTPVQKIFYAKMDHKVNVGVEFNQVFGLHELAVIWYSPDQNIHHIQYEAIEPEVEGEMYSIIVWLKLLLKDIEREVLEGIWSVNILLDGELIGIEQFAIKGDII